MTQSWNDKNPTDKTRTEAAKNQANVVADTSKQEAAAVKDTAAQQAGQVKDTAANEAKNVKDTAAEGAQNVKETATAEAQNVKDTAVDAAQQLGDTAKGEAQQVAGEAADQIRSLIDTTRGEVRNRAADGQVALTSTLTSLSDELSRMTRGETTNGPVAQFVGELAMRGEGLTSWLQNHEPDDVVVEVRRFAARRPVAFLAIAAGAGMLAGRVARGTRELSKDQQPRQQIAPRAATYPTDYAPTGQYATTREHTTGYPTEYQPQGNYAGDLRTDGTRVSEGYVRTTTDEGLAQGHPGNSGQPNGGNLR